VTPEDEEFRAAWPRVVRILAGWCGSLDLAEEHAAEAMARAVQHEGVIDDLAAWAVRVGQRSFLDETRRRVAFHRASADLVRTDRVSVEPAPGAAEAGSAGDPAEAMVDTGDLPEDLDDRVALLFVACDEELPRAGQMVLALRVVCGLSVVEIATHLGIQQSAAAARLTRAKKALAQARGRFAIPDPATRAARLPVVLDCVAGMFTVAHRDGLEPRDALEDLGVQALSLADALVRLYPEDPEVRGLRALVLLGLARRAGRVDAQGVALTLDEVDRTTWDRPMLAAGLRDATFAARGGSGRFAIEAAISGLHSTAPSTAATDWRTVVQLYDALERVWPSPAVEVARCVAGTRADDSPDVRRGAEQRLRELAESGPAYARRDAAFALADLLWRAQRREEASERYDALAEVAVSEPVRRFCLRRALGCEDPEGPGAS
jgi:predicted RNA polymerase sigma factor